MGYLMKIVDDIAVDAIVADEDFKSIIEKSNPGTWIYNEKNQNSMNYTDGVFWEPQPYPSWTLDANKVWQPPVPKDNDEWVESLGKWVTIDEFYAITLNQAARDYLNETDWYIIRKTETGVEVPADILTNRAKARTDIVKET